MHVNMSIYPYIHGQILKPHDEKESTWLVDWQLNDAPKPRGCLKDAQSQTTQGKNTKCGKTCMKGCGTR